MDTSAYFAHPTAVVDEGAVIGAGSKIWHFSHVMPGCEIGERCILGQNVLVSPKVKLGHNVKVQNNVSIYTGVYCEDDVFLGPSMVFTNVINPRSFLERKEEFKPTLVQKGASIGANATVVCGVTIGAYA
ncbi:MAG: N-acetyltransferase, partial [Saprospiraceae bacterium]|nr:N-acetyltransferase [Saprospiraceae bacterium]